MLSATQFKAPSVLHGHRSIFLKHHYQRQINHVNKFNTSNAVSTADGRASLLVTNAKTFEGVVISDHRMKSRVVYVRKWRWFPRYMVKRRRGKRYMCHDEKMVSRMGDYVTIKEVPRKISPKKSFYIQKILRRAEPDLCQPREVKYNHPDRTKTRYGPRKLAVRRSGQYSWIYRTLQKRRDQLIKEGKLDSDAAKKYYF